MAPGSIVLPSLPSPVFLEAHMLQEVFLTEENQLVSWGFWQSVESMWIASGLNAGTGNTHERSSVPSASKPSVDLVQYPWMEQYLHASAESQEPAAKKQNRTIPDDADQDAMDRAYKVFQDRKREFFIEQGIHAEDDFTTALKGGRWTQAVLHTPYNLCEARARSPVAVEWVAVAGLHRIASFSFAKYGEEPASLLAVAWCHRMSFLIETFPSPEAVPDDKWDLSMDQYKVPASVLKLRKLYSMKPAVVK
eukprot:6474861-Amphidinium_carterae.1